MHPPDCLNALLVQVQEGCQPEQLLDFLASLEASQAAGRADTAAQSLRLEEQVRAHPPPHACRDMLLLLLLLLLPPPPAVLH